MAWATTRTTALRRPTPVRKISTPMGMGTLAMWTSITTGSLMMLITVPRLRMRARRTRTPMARGTRATATKTPMTTSGRTISTTARPMPTPARRTSTTTVRAMCANWTPTATGCWVSSTTADWSRIRVRKIRMAMDWAMLAMTRWMPTRMNGRTALIIVRRWPTQTRPMATRTRWAMRVTTAQSTPTPISRTHRVRAPGTPAVMRTLMAYATGSSPIPESSWMKMTPGQTPSTMTPMTTA